MRAIGFAAVFAIVGGLVGCGAAWWAASNWSSFSDRWLYAAGFAPAAGAVLGAWIGTPKEGWPPGMPKKLAVAGVSTVLAAISSYVAFALVSNAWNNVAHDAGEFVSLLTSPARIPDIFSSKGSAASFAEGPIMHLVLGAFVGLICPFVFIRKSGEKE